MLRIISLAIIIILFTFIGSFHSHCEGLSASYGAAVVEQQGSRSIAVLTINGKQVLKLYNPQNGSTAANLLAMLAEAIPKLANKFGNRVYIKEDSKAHNIWHLYLGDQLLLSVNQSEAAAQGKTVQNLAKEWAINLSNALNNPPLAIKQDKIKLNLGETFILQVQGADQYPLQAFASNQAYFKVKINSKNSVELIPIKVGHSALILSRKNLSLKIPVEITNAPIPIQPKVDLYPVVVVGASSLEDVTPKSNSDSNQPTENLPSDNATSEPTSSNSTTSEDNQPTVKRIGIKDNKIPENVPDYIQKPKRDINKELINIKPNPTTANFVNITDEDRWLFYSNDPETVYEPQILYAAELPAGDRSRIFFHHLNRTNAKQNLYCSVINTSAEPINLAVKMGIGGGHPNAILTGYASANNYLRNGFSSVLIEPNKLTPLTIIPLQHGYVCTGLISLYAPRQANLRLVISLGQAPVMPPTYINPRTNMYFENPVLTANREVIIGYRWDFLKIGHIEKLQNLHGHNLHGNYGVTYRINYKIINPSNETVKVELALLPSGGAVKMPFRINGQFYESDMLRGGDEPKGFASFSLKPGETKRFTLETIPVGGAWYPTTLVVRKFSPLNNSSSALPPVGL